MKVISKRRQDLPEILMGAGPRARDVARPKALFTIDSKILLHVHVRCNMNFVYWK